MIRHLPGHRIVLSLRSDYTMAKAPRWHRFIAFCFSGSGQAPLPRSGTALIAFCFSGSGQAPLPRSGTALASRRQRSGSKLKLRLTARLSSRTGCRRAPPGAKGLSGRKRTRQPRNVRRKIAIIRRFTCCLSWRLGRIRCSRLAKHCRQPIELPTFLLTHPFRIISFSGVLSGRRGSPAATYATNLSANVPLSDQPLQAASCPGGGARRQPVLSDKRAEGEA